MLQIKPKGNIYAKPTFSRIYILGILNELNSITQPEKNLRVNDSGQCSLEEFMNLQESRRSDLAYRLLMGEELPKKEQRELDDLNRLLNDLLEKPRPEPSNVIQARIEAELLLNQLRNG